MSTKLAPFSRIGFIGAGRTGCVLAHALARADYKVVGVASRSATSAEALARGVAGCTAMPTARAVVNACDLVFLTVPDGAIKHVAESVRWRSGTAAVHCSGAGSLDLLSAASRAGVLAGTFHPLQTFADVEQGLANLAGSTFAIEANASELKGLLETMASRLGGDSVVLQPGDKILYHASAVFASNYLITLADLSAGLWEHFGIAKHAALRALLPLIRGAVANLEAVGLPDALTGPIVRGDVGSVAAHLQALCGLAESDGSADVYRTLARRTIQLAQERGDIDNDQARAFSAVLLATREGNEDTT